MSNLLIISNNPLSEVQNNGKTILSMIEGIDKSHIHQLYFNINDPTVFGYDYYRISDKDIIKGIIFHSKRGSIVEPKHNTTIIESSNTVRNDLFRLIRELLWYKKWKSAKLVHWLNDFKPDAIFFVGGDCVFAYDIALSIQKEYNARLSLFITDDYIMKRKRDSVVGKIRKQWIKNRIKRTLSNASSFFTISEIMKKTYFEMFGVDSYVINNIPESMKIERNQSSNDIIQLIYAGSLYYGREDTIQMLVDVLSEYNKSHKKKARLNIYSNTKPDHIILQKVCKEDVSVYRGSLSKPELILELNNSDILVFVESFQEEEIEKVRLSFSTKIPEYLSIGKPILAIGPNGIGSMDYLKDAAKCVTDPNDLKDHVYDLLLSDQQRAELGQRASNKFDSNYNRESIQRRFREMVMGEMKNDEDQN